MQQGGTFASKSCRIIFAILLIIYIFILTFLTLFGRFRGGVYIHRSINIVPFDTILQYLASSINPAIIRTNILGNIEAFMPMGFLLPLNFKRMREFKKMLLVAVIVTVSIEVLQYITGLGASDIDDIILNVLGGVFGYILYKILIKVFNGIIQLKGGRLK